MKLTDRAKFLLAAVVLVLVLAVSLLGNVTLLSMYLYQKIDCTLKTAKVMDALAFEQNKLNELAHEADELRSIIEKLRPDLPKEKAKDLAVLFQEAGAENHINPKLLIRIAWVESHLGKFKKSHAGAIGVMQVMPLWVEKLDFINHVRDLSDPKLNIKAGAYIYAVYREDTNYDHHLALLYYNRGPGKVQSLQAKGLNPDNGYPRRVLASF